MYYRHLLVLFLMLVSCCASQAQQPPVPAGTSIITGRVVDSATAEPIEYASVALSLQGETRVINGAVADDKGKFTIDHVPEGTYTLTINFLGYNKLVKDNIIAVSKYSTVQTGDILLVESKSRIKPVTVIAEKNIIENKIDKIVFNVDRDITSQGGSATDILTKVPMVSVDVDGNVQLMGNSSILFLIDGKPSTMYGNSLVDVLKSIPASQIQSIEIVTSPGAKYDAEGTGGIINIILKKNNVRGFNGNINLSAGTRLENGSFNLNYRHDNFGARAYMSGNTNLPASTLNSNYRISTDAQNRTTELVQSGISDYVRNGYDGGLGFDWNITPNNSIAGVIGTSYQGNKYSGYTNQQLKQDSAGTTLFNENTRRYSINNYNNNSIYWNLNYKKTFAKKGQELNLQYNANYGKTSFIYNQTQTNEPDGSPAGASNGNNPSTSRESTFQADYTHPFSESFILETGAKANFRSLNTISDVQTSSDGINFNYDPTQSFLLNYGRDVYAVYASGTFSLFHFLDVKAGERYELTHTTIGYSNNNVLIPDYNTFAPSITVAHTFTNSQTFKLSYSHRIERPDYRVLSPFVNTSDPKNISQGDPFLQPEISDKIEAGYNKSFNGGANINIVLFYRTSDHDIQQYVVYHPTYKVGDSTFTNVSVSTYANVGLEQNEGINIFGSYPITPKLNVRGNLSFFNRYIISGEPGAPNISSFNYRANVNATYQFNKNLIAEFSGNFNSARNELQGRYPSWTTYNMAIRQQLWHEKGSIALTGTNVFNEYIDQPTEITGTGFVQNSLRRVPFRSFGINFTYKFGKLAFKKKPSDEDKQDNPDNQQ
jgi:ferric enterobactin receptor